MFDVLVVANEDVMPLPLSERRARLLDLLAEVPALDDSAPHVRVVDQVVHYGEAMYAAAVDIGLEGVIAKRLASPYRPGVRSRDWLKIKRPGAVPTERFEH